MEHSLEVQVPFLQKDASATSRWCRSPVGNASVSEVARTIDQLWGGEETLIVVSTDLSHYHGYDEAPQASTAGRWRELRVRNRSRSRGSVRRHAAERAAAPRARQGLSIRPLAANNSGDTCGRQGPESSGYSAFALDDDRAARDGRRGGTKAFSRSHAPAIARELGDGRLAAK
jgi:AmmeMemoRadiSam system protein B